MKEQRVYTILAKWFANEGYQVEEKAIWHGGPKIDIVAEKNTNHELWIVEVKGDYDKDVAQYNVNFDTGMGQLLKSVTRIDDNTNYGIAIPFSRTEARGQYSYRLILPKYSQSLAFEKLNIHLILIYDNESIKFIKPAAVNKFLQEYSKNKCFKICQ